MKTIKIWTIHCLYGLFAQCWDGAIASVAAIFTMDATGKLPEGVNWSVVWHTFAGAGAG